MMQYRYIKILFAIALCPVLAFAFAATAADDVIVICNKSITQKSIKKKDLQRVLLGKMKKFGGKKVVLAAVKGAKADKTAFRKACKKDPRQFWMSWKRLAFTGKGDMPKDLPDAAALAKHIAATANSISFVPAGTDVSGCTVLKVQ